MSHVEGGTKRFISENRLLFVPVKRSTFLVASGIRNLAVASVSNAFYIMREVDEELVCLNERRRGDASCL